MRICVLGLVLFGCHTRTEPAPVAKKPLRPVVAVAATPDRSATTATAIPAPLGLEWTMTQAQAKAALKERFELVREGPEQWGQTNELVFKGEVDQLNAESVALDFCIPTGQLVDVAIDFGKDQSDALFPRWKHLVEVRTRELGRAPDRDREDEGPIHPTHQAAAGTDSAPPLPWEAVWSFADDSTAGVDVRVDPFDHTTQLPGLKFVTVNVSACRACPSMSHEFE